MPRLIRRDPVCAWVDFWTRAGAAGVVAVVIGLVLAV